MSEAGRKFDFKAAAGALLPAVGSLFLYVVWIVDADGVLAMKELAVGAALFLGVWLLSAALFNLIFNGKRGRFLLCLAASLTFAFALNVKAPELMRLPLSLPASNGIRVTALDDGARLEMSWAYRFRPRDLTDDPFLWDADADISFASLETSGEWDTEETDAGPLLKTSDPAAALAVNGWSPSHLTVFCLSVYDGTAEIETPSGTMTLEPVDQPNRVILTGGMIPSGLSFALQLLLWTAALMLPAAMLCGLCMVLSCLRGAWAFYLAAFCIPCGILLLLCLILGITPFGEKTFLINDMWGEYGDWLAYLRTILSGENSFFYSFSKSLGDDTLAMYAYHLINPLNWIVCAFDPEDLPLAVTLLVILRYGISGVTMAAYLRGGRKMGAEALIFSTCYALSAFQFVNAENTNLRESLMLLPLVILGLERLLDGESPRLFRISLAVAIFINYYSGFQVCLFSALYFVYYSLLKPDDFGKRFLRFIVNAVIAVLLDAVLLFPVVMQLGGTQKNFGLSGLSFDLLMGPRELLGKLLNSAYDAGQIHSDGLPSLFCGMLMLTLVMLFFFAKRIPRREKLLTGGMLLVLAAVLSVNALNLLAHGLNNPEWWPFRDAFCVCFFMIITAARAWQERESLPGYAYLAALALTAGICALCGTAGYSWLGSADAWMSFAFTACFLLLTAASSVTVTAAALAAVLCAAELGINGYHILNINTTFERTNTVSDYRAFYEPNKALFDELKAYDDGFYRVEKSYTRTANDAFVFDTYGISHYSSTLKRSLMDFLPRAGYRYYPFRFFYWEGSTAAMDSLLGVKYLVTYSPNVDKGYESVLDDGTRYVHRNDEALTAAFTADPGAADAVIPSELEGFPLQNALYAALTGDDTPIFIQALETDDEGCSAGYEWTVDIDRADTLYAFFPSDEIHYSRLTYGDRGLDYFYSFSYNIQSLGAFTPGESLDISLIPYEDTVCLRDAQFYYEDRAALSKAVAKLSADPVTVTRTSGASLSVTADVSEDRLLFFSLPYDKGWRILVDGERVDAVEIFDVFMGVPLSTGSHTITMEFIPRGFILGAAVSLLSLLGMGFVGVKTGKKRQ